MKPRLLAALILILALAFGTRSSAAPRVELEIVTEQGVQITAPQQWLQLLARAGHHNVRIRGARAGDEPSAKNIGTAERPSYKVVAMLTRDERLRLPGATFGRADVARLEAYFERLAADGAESLTAPRGRYGLSEPEMKSVLSALSQPIVFTTKGDTLQSVLERVEANLKLPLVVEATARRTLREAATIEDEVEGLTTGTALALLLWNQGLVIRPVKPHAQPVELRIAPVDDDARRTSTLGRPEDTAQSFWPIGWDPEARPRELAPSLFESLNVEIDNFTLQETLDAVLPRLKVPLFLDRASLARSQIDLSKVTIKVAPARMFYLRLLERVLAQARLGASLRIDEAGTPFLWVTR